MKIVRIIARLNVGGPARHVVWLTKDLQDQEFQSILVTGKIVQGEEEDMSYFAAENGVQFISIPEMQRNLTPKDTISLWKIYRQFLREKPDIVHTHTAKAGTVGRIAGFFYRWMTWKTLLGKPRRVKFVHTFHGHFFHSYYGKSKTKIFLFIEKMLARFATDKIIVISRQQFGEIHKKFGVGKTEQLRVIPLGIDIKPFADWRAKQNTLREEVGAANDEILVGIIGRLTEVKNHLLFLRTVKLYRESANSPKMKFIVIGDGHLREELEAEAEILGVKDSVIFLGNRNDADIFYAGLDIIALTSFNEGTPLSLIEAMANEKAVISTSVGGVVDLLGEIEFGKRGFQVCERGVSSPSNDAASFFNGLMYLANDAKIREELGKKGRKFIEMQYSKTRLVDDIKKLYRELTEKNI